MSTAAKTVGALALVGSLTSDVITHKADIAIRDNRFAAEYHVNSYGTTLRGDIKPDTIQGTGCIRVGLLFTARVDVIIPMPSVQLEKKIEHMTLHGTAHRRVGSTYDFEGTVADTLHGQTAYIHGEFTGSRSKGGSFNGVMNYENQSDSISFAYNVKKGFIGCRKSDIDNP